MTRYIGAVTLSALISIAVLVASCGNGDDSAPLTPEPTTASEETPASTDQAAVIDVVNRFVQGLSAGNALVLYNLQTEEFKAACPMEQFEAVVESLQAELLRGPVRAAINGDQAVAELFLQSGRPASLTLERATDGTWRVVSALQSC